MESNRVKCERTSYNDIKGEKVIDIDVLRSGKMSNFGGEKYFGEECT